MRAHVVAAALTLDGVLFDIVVPHYENHVCGRLVTFPANQGRGTGGQWG